MKQQLLCFATDHLIGQKIKQAKENNSLQPTHGAAGNQICASIISQEYISNKIDFVPLACKDADRQV